MSEQTIISVDDEESRLVPMAAVGLVANRVAADHLFANYINRKSDSTIATQKAALMRFGEYLGEVGISGLTAVRLQTEPDAWRGLSWGLVEGFVKWQLAHGFAVTTVNNRLSAGKVYARMAAKAGGIAVQELQLIKAVAGYGRPEAKRIDARWPLARVGDKKEAPLRLTADQARLLKNKARHPARTAGCALLLSAFGFGAAGR